MDALYWFDPSRAGPTYHNYFLPATPLLTTSGQGHTTRDFFPLSSLRLQDRIRAAFPRGTGSKRCGSRHSQLQPTLQSPGFVDIICDRLPGAYRKVKVHQSGGLPVSASHM